MASGEIGEGCMRHFCPRLHVSTLVRLVALERLQVISQMGRCHEVAKASHGHAEPTDDQQRLGQRTARVARDVVERVAQNTAHERANGHTHRPAQLQQCLCCPPTSGSQHLDGCVHALRHTGRCGPQSQKYNKEAETGDNQRDAAEQKMKQVRSSCAPQQSAMIFQTLADSVNQVPTNPRRNSSSAAQRNAQGQADGLRRDVVQPLGERRNVAVITAQQPV
mmetsp:Transcript_2774/g.8273  ORF Transcript_2774/g.8273 Transcript_2774/m.8273 type:complete len:221 (-) Transcript_2774:824-1486(-)